MMHTLAKFCINIHLYTILHVIETAIIAIAVTALVLFIGTSIIIGGIDIYRNHLINGPITAPLGSLGVILDMVLAVAALVCAMMGISTFWKRLKKTITEEKQND